MVPNFKELWAKELQRDLMLAKGTVLMITSDPLQRLALMVWMVHMKMLINAVNKWEDK